MLCPSSRLGTLGERPCGHSVSAVINTLSPERSLLEVEHTRAHIMIKLRTEL